MTIYEYERSKRNKQIKRKLTVAACVVAALVAVCVAYHQGTKAGRAWVNYVWENWTAYDFENEPQQGQLN